MKAADLIDSVEILKKVQAKQDEIDKVNEKLQKELGELIAKLPAGVKSLLNGDSAKSVKSEGEKRERVTITDDQKAEIAVAVKDVLKKAKNGAKFSEIMESVTKTVKFPFKATHLRPIMQNDKGIVMKGEKINALWFAK